MKIYFSNIYTAIPLDEYLVYGDHSWEIRQLLLKGEVSYYAPHNHQRYGLQIIKEVGSKDIIVKYLVVDVYPLSSGEVKLTLVSKHSPEQIIRIDNGGDPLFFDMIIKTNAKKL